MVKTKRQIKAKTFSPTKIKTIILSVAIAIIFFAFVAYLIQAIYPSPQYSDFCEIERTLTPPDKNTTQETQEDYSKCSKEYELVRDQYNFVVFIVAVISGLIAIVVGIVLLLPSVSSGLMVGGTFLMIYGTARYWSNLSNWIRTLILAIVLAILIFLAYKKLKN